MTSPDRGSIIFVRTVIVRSAERESAMEKKILTQAGLEKLETELNELKINRRKDIAQKIIELLERHRHANIR